VEVRQKLSDKTKVAIIVNTFGAPAEISKIKSLGIRVIEDCSHGFMPDNSTPGQLGVIRGDVAIFSFYATKLIAGGEGGALLSNDKAILDFARNFRDYTDKEPDGFRLNDKLTDITAALVFSQLKNLEQKIRERNRIAKFYTDAFHGIDKHYQLPNINSNRIWYRYVLRLLSNKNISSIIETMSQKGVGTVRPVKMWIRDKGNKYKNSFLAETTVISIPIYSGLIESETRYVVQSLLELLND